MNIIMYVNCIFLHFQDQNMQYHIEKKNKKKTLRFSFLAYGKNPKFDKRGLI